jgi:hypothetical protein
MYFQFDDPHGTNYRFELNPEPDIKEPHVEIRVHSKFFPGTGVTIRRIKNKSIAWVNDDDRYVSEEAKHYIGKVIKNLAFC